MKYTELDPSRSADQALQFEDDLRKLIVGQEKAIQAAVQMYKIWLGGLNDPTKPLGTMLFLGPTGSGKTRFVEALGEVCFNNEKAPLKIDCGELQHSHEIAKLVGSPAGYLGHGDTPPLLSQERLTEFQTEKHKFSIVLFDEIEKAHEALYQMLLAIMDKGQITTGKNKPVLFNNSWVIMTSNLGTTEINDLGRGLGFTREDESSIAKKMTDRAESISMKAMRRKFSAEFVNRIDKTVVFEALTKSQMKEVLDIELMKVQMRILNALNAKFVFVCSKDVKDYLLDDGYDAKFGARHLKRSIEKNITLPLAELKASNQIQEGDELSIVISDGKLKFFNVGNRFQRI